MVNGVGLVARPEVEEPPAAAAVTAPRAEHFAALEPRREHESVGVRNAERFAVGLRLVDDDSLVEAVGGGVTGVGDPEPLALTALPVGEVTRRPQQSGERL